MSQGNYISDAEIFFTGHTKHYKLQYKTQIAGAHAYATVCVTL
jgi:hypothetical protein